MARENKAERFLREVAEEAARMDALEAAYPERLMTSLTRAYENNYEVIPKNTEFHLVDRDDRDNTFRVSYAFSEANDAALNELDWTLTYKEEQAREERRKYEVRTAALAKLNDEEKRLLNLR